jgi:hypothetical protein
LILVLASVPETIDQTQQDNSKPKAVEYGPGQLWVMDRGITVTILTVEDVQKVGKVVHVRVDKIPSGTCGDVHLAGAIEHLAITEQMMLKSDLVLSKNVDLPESSIEAYRKWEGEKKQEVATVPLQKAISGGGERAICNLVPRRT